ncbi:UNVERIFIED_CONTAM: hypothetical protein Sindi_2833800 [Sesamum indicum]
MNYIVIRVDEVRPVLRPIVRELLHLKHDFTASSFIEDNSGSGPMPAKVQLYIITLELGCSLPAKVQLYIITLDIPPPIEVDAAAGSEYPPPPNQLRANDGNIRNSSPQDSPSIEIMGHARHGFDFNSSPILPDRSDPDKFLEEQINTDKATCSTVTGVLLPDDCFSSPRNHEEQHSLKHLDSPMVVKSNGLVDVHQQNPYDDISIKLIPKLSKGQFSG